MILTEYWGKWKKRLKRIWWLIQEINNVSDESGKYFESCNRETLLHEQVSWSLAAGGNKILAIATGHSPDSLLTKLCPYPLFSLVATSHWKLLLVNWWDKTFLFLYSMMKLDKTKHSPGPLQNLHTMCMSELRL